MCARPKLAAMPERPFQTSSVLIRSSLVRPMRRPGDLRESKKSAACDANPFSPFAVSDCSIQVRMVESPVFNSAMNRLKTSIKTFCGVAVGVLLALTSSVHPASGAGDKGKVDEAIFTNNSVLSIEIEISNRDMSTLRRYQWNRDAKLESRTPVPAMIREGSVLYTNVAVHLKVAVGSFRPVDDKPGLTLNFHKLAKGQRFHGLEKISLNNSVQDPSCITDKLCREVFDKAGVPVTRAGYANVKLNGRVLGLYVLTEGWNKQFLKRYFKNAKGNLYDGGFVKDITGPMIVNSGENHEDRSDLKPLIAACREKNLTNRLIRLEKTLDLDRFLTFIALDALLWNWDGYALNRNNYRLFHDLDTDRFIFFPHGMDQMFWKPDGPIMPGMKGLVAESVIAIPECRRRYLERVSELMNGVIRPEALTNRVNELARQIQPVQSETAGWGSVMRGIFQPSPVKELKQHIVQRSQSLEEQLQGVKSVLRFDNAGTAHLSGWKSRTLYGRLGLDQPDKTPASLHLTARQARSAGAWWMTAWLEGGHYQIRGKVRVQGVTAADSHNPRSGAGFRVFSRRKLTTGVNWDWFPFRESNDLEKRGEIPVPPASKIINRKLSGSADWVELTCDFDLRQPVADLE